MDQQILRIRELLKQNIFLAQEKKQEILNRLDQMSESQLTQIESVLQRGASAQVQLVQDAQKNDPDFLKKVDQKIRGAVRSDRKDRESQERSTESKELEGMEKDFDGFLS